MPYELDRLIIETCGDHNPYDVLLTVLTSHPNRLNLTQESYDLWLKRIELLHKHKIPGPNLIGVRDDKLVMLWQEPMSLENINKAAVALGALYMPELQDISGTTSIWITDRYLIRSYLGDDGKFHENELYWEVQPELV